MKKIIILLLSFSLLLTSCGSDKEECDKTAETKSEIQTPYESVDTETPAETENAKSGEEFAEAFLESWKDGEVGKYYKYVSLDIALLLDETEFEDIFSNITDIFGEIEGFEKTGQSKSSGQDVFKYKVRTEYADIHTTVSVNGTELTGIFHNVRFRGSFDKKYDNGVTERYFIIQSGDYSLNAVYTFSDKGSAPAALLIPGSGPSDYNETVGLLEPFRDVALGLAGHGVNSLRIEKRTVGYPEKWTETCGMNEEYFEDFTAALKWLEKQRETERVYLIGHSLGGQVAPIIAEEGNVAGVILFNSTLRHLADITADQLTAQDAENGPLYLRFAANAKKATADGSTGQSYFGMTDYAWASYNDMDFTDAIERSDIPYLIINSRNDKQIFEKDIELWKSEFGDKENVTVKIYDDISHQGYSIDASDAAAVYNKADFSKEVISDFAGFCK